MIKKLVVIIVLSLAFIGTASADGFDDAMAEWEAANYKAAFAGLKPLANQGDAKAQGNLGLMYYMGLGVPQDYFQAHVWFNLAAASGHEPSFVMRDEVAKEMTPEQIAEAQKFAREWAPS